MKFWFALSALLALQLVNCDEEKDPEYKDSTFKLMLENKDWSNFFQSISLRDSYKTMLSDPGHKDTLTIIRPQKINSPKKVAFSVEISHNLENPTIINLTGVYEKTSSNFTIHVGTTTSECNDYPLPLGETCIRSSDYRIYHNYKDVLMHNCLLIFWPVYRSGGKFCYKMYDKNTKSSLDMNSLIVSAAGDDIQAVYLPVVLRDDVWKVLKIVE